MMENRTLVSLKSTIKYVWQCSKYTSERMYICTNEVTSIKYLSAFSNYFHTLLLFFFIFQLFYFHF